MFKITATYNKENFNASLPNNKNVLIFSKVKRDDFISIGKGTYEKNIPMSNLEEYYLERFLVFYKGHKTGIIKFIPSKNILILGTTNIELANNLRFYKSEGNQWIKNVNFSDIEKIAIERYDFLTEEKIYREYKDNFENLIKLKLSSPKKEEEDKDEEKEEKFK